MPGDSVLIFLDGWGHGNWLATVRAYDLGILFGDFVQEDGKRVAAVLTQKINLIAHNLDSILLRPPPSLRFNPSKGVHLFVLARASDPSRCGA